MNYIKNYETKKISDFRKEELSKFVLTLINNMLSYCNRKIDKERLKYLVVNFIKDITAIEDLREGEVTQAIENGQRGEYGEIYDINNLLLYKFVKSYLENEERRNIIFNYKNKNKMQEENEEMQDKASLYFLKKQFEMLKNKEIDFIKCYGGASYDILKKYKYAVRDYTEFIEAAKRKILEQETQKLIKERNIFARREIQQNLKEIECKGSEDIYLINRAKELAVNDYFKSLL